ncbi:MAG: D-2-hydroxyacid dehydrogenase, partial [Synergistaceae bacterium]|nr:D-2-hydroxyacid dehydrogenase [Synergistaceae bacterium]
MKNGKTHIHIQNSRSSVDVFIADKQQVKDLLARNPDLKDSLEITVGSSAVDPVDLWTKEDLDEYYGHMATADILVGYSFPGKDIEKYAPRLRWIHFISSGVEHMSPFDWVPEGLQLVNNRGVHLAKSGESFAMFLYMLNSAMPRLYTAQRNRTWDRAFTTVIRGKKLVVLGVGHQGGEIARMAREMGLHVTGIHPTRKEHPHCDRVMANSEMKEAFADADFLAIAAPLTEETRG